MSDVRMSTDVVYVHRRNEHNHVVVFFLPTSPHITTDDVISGTGYIITYGTVIES